MSPTYLFSLMSVNPLYILIWAFYIGLVCGFGTAILSRKIPGIAVRALAAKEAFTPETAVTLAEAGLTPREQKRLQKFLRHGTPLRKYVLAKDEELALRVEKEEGGFVRFLRKFFSLEKEPHYDYDFAAQKWYLPEETRYTAAVRFDTRGFNVQMFILAALLLFVLALALCWALPYLSDLYNQMLDGMRGAR